MHDNSQRAIKKKCSNSKQTAKESLIRGEGGEGNEINSSRNRENDKQIDIKTEIIYFL
jgi:hypothetical protein